MIRFEIDTEINAPFVALPFGGHVKVVENPKLTSRLPYWLQEFMLNDILREAIPSAPRPVRRAMAAEVVDIARLREAREARIAKQKGCGRTS